MYRALGMIITILVFCAIGGVTQYLTGLHPILLAIPIGIVGGFSALVVGHIFHHRFSEKRDDWDWL